MSRSKLGKYAAIAKMDNVYERNAVHKGEWSKAHFGNENDIVLELACGKGDYARGLAEIFPNKNFIGVDLKGNRIYTAANLAKKGGLNNIAFIREQIDHLPEYFAENEISEIWITFPDPFLKNSKRNKRLTSPKFIEVYRQFLKKEGFVHLKTDSLSLYEYTKEIIEELKLKTIKDYPDVYAMDKQESELHNIQTYYERMHLEDKRTIMYLCFQID